MLKIENRVLKYDTFPIEAWITQGSVIDRYDLINLHGVVRVWGSKILNHANLIRSLKCLKRKSGGELTEEFVESLAIVPVGENIELVPLGKRR